MNLLPGRQNTKRKTVPLAIANSVDHECRQEESKADKTCFKYVFRILPVLSTRGLG